MNYVIGFGFLAVAAVVGFFGDRSVQKKGGTVLRVFSWPPSTASCLKYPIAAVLAGVGVWFLLVGVA